MAKRGIITHRKTRRLAMALGIDQTYAVGILESLWQVTSEQCPRGDIGSLLNQDIADEMFCGINAETLISALCASGWLDAHDDYRLVIHGWSEHADDMVHQRIARMGDGTFCDGSVSKRYKPKTTDASGQSPTNSEINRQTPRKFEKNGLPEPEPEPEPEPGIYISSIISKNLKDSKDAPVPVAEIKPSRKSKPDLTWFEPWFEQFRAAYPKRQGNNWKQAGIKLKRLFEGSSPPDPKEVLAGAVAYAKTNPEPDFTAHVTTWVNQSRWCADYSQVAHTPTKPGDKFKTWTPEDLAEMGGN